MAVDGLSAVVDLVEVRGVLSGGFAARGRWFTRAEVHLPLKFLAVPFGQVRLTTDGLDTPLTLQAGDVAILNDRSWLRLDGGTGDEPPREVMPDEHFSFAVDRERDDVVVGGRIDLSSAGRALLLNALPPVVHIGPSTPATSSLRGCVHRIVDEMTSTKPGAAFAIRQHGQLLLLEILRTFMSTNDLPPGWLAALRDERLRPALDLMHDRPERAWSLHELARAAAMSRTTFAVRFREVAGTPPLTYLTRWRMLLAQRALRDGNVRIASLAAKLGYASEAAFSTAFKREVGEAPLRFKSHLATGTRPPATAGA
ncbi:AraC family transcriptional regulator [Phytohabitans sp. LJ34]|uniref:AraC family transcriptional regulator n=1 Tax=Phytohabitans sp. LJ34 TaxID=3452217 RepID=UPI003F8A9DF0